jgi:hypothetical protein
LALEAPAAAPAFLFMMARAIELDLRGCARERGLLLERNSGCEKKYWWLCKRSRKEWADVANLLKFLVPKIDPSSTLGPP